MKLVANYIILFLEGPLLPSLSHTVLSASQDETVGGLFGQKSHDYIHLVCVVGRESTEPQQVVTCLFS